jgi:lipoprotein-releasing system ATP-binding protein
LKEDSLLQLEGVGKTFDREVLSDINLTVNEDSCLALMGVSGSGKSSLLNIMASFEKPDKGRVLFQGRDLSAFSEKEVMAYRRDEIGFVFQQHHLLPQSTVLENILLPCLAKGPVSPGGPEEKRALSLLERLTLTEHKNKFPGQLSGGECQRVAVIRALINAPRILLADEPTGALDSENAHSLIDLLLELREEEKVALLLVTHSEALAKKLQSQMFLSDGKLVSGDKA